MKDLKKKFVLRYILKFLAFIFLVLSICGFSWGNYMVPVQKSAASVAFVFDISNSMLAKDCEDGKSRLEAASLYAKKLLTQISKMENTAVSVVLAKGEGVNVIPQTEDYEIIYSLLDVLSPNLVSVPGTSLAKGIICAKDSFSSHFATANKIWVFTDGEETDGQLSQSMEECVKSGVVLTIIGFGSETESEVFAGDNKTKIKSALRTENIMDSIAQAQKKFPYIDFSNQQKLIFMKADEKGSAVRLLTQVRSSGFVTFEARQVPRFQIFLIAAVVLYILSFLITEFDYSIFSKKKNQKGKISTSNSVLLIFSMMIIFVIFTGCNQASSEDKKIIYDGVNAFQHKKYNQAISYFLRAGEKARKKDNQMVNDYSLYNLGTCYIMKNEDAAAIMKFSQISENGPDSLRYAAFYNAGIVAYRNQDVETAAEYFRKALEIDSSKIEAKVNLELCVNKIEVNVRQYESKVNPVEENKSDNSDEESSIFDHIKENDKNQWKNSQMENNINLAEDY